MEQYNQGAPTVPRAPMLKNWQIRALARWHCKQNYWVLLLLSAVYLAPGILWSAFSPLLRLPAWGDWTATILFNIIRYPLSLGCLYCFFSCYRAGSVSLHQLARYYTDRQTLKTVAALAVAMTLISAVSGLPGLAVGFLPQTNITLMMWNLLFFVVTVVVFYFTLRFFLVPYLFFAQGQKPAGELLRKSFAYTWGTIWRQFTMAFFFTGWMLLLVLPVFFLMAILTISRGMAYDEQLMMLLVQGMMIFLYPYIGLSLAGLANELLPADVLARDMRNSQDTSTQNPR